MAFLPFQGLAYSVSGGWDTPLDHPGLFAAGGNTAAPAQFLEQLQRVLQVCIPLLLDHPHGILFKSNIWPLHSRPAASAHHPNALKGKLHTFSLHSDGGASEGLLCWSLSLRCYTSVLSSIPWHAVQEAAEVAPTEEEVATAKSETLNSFVFNFASTNAQMQRVAAYALLGIPEVTWDLIPPLLLGSCSARPHAPAALAGMYACCSLHRQNEPHACPDTPDVSHLEAASLKMCVNYS